MPTINSGSIPAFVQTLLSLLALLWPGVFTPDRVARTGVMVLSLIGAALGMWQLIDEIIAARKTPNAPSGSASTSGSSAMLRSIILLALLVPMISLAGGCETSGAFKAAVINSAPRIATAADGYLKADTTLNPSDASTRATQLTMFRSATTQPITFHPVFDSWGAIRPWFVKYAATDPAYKVSPDPTAGLALPNSFDDLIEHERERRSIWFADTPPAMAR